MAVAPGVVGLRTGAGRLSPGGVLVGVLVGAVGCAQPFNPTETGTGTDGGESSGTSGGGGGDHTQASGLQSASDTAESSGDTGSLTFGDPPPTAGESSSSGEPACGEGVDVPENAEGSICPPQRSTTERIVECICTYDPPLLSAAERPTDATDLLYYVNRWHSIDPCFPWTPGSTLLQSVRDTYINAVGDLEPHMLSQCGDYEDAELIQVPGNFTNDDDELLVWAWSSVAPVDYLQTLAGESVGRDGLVGFAPMFAAAADAGISLYIASGFRSMQRQSDLFEYYAGQRGDPALAAVYSAWPAHSEHQLGTTADVGYIEDGDMISPFDPLESDLHHSEAFTWIRANAHKFGIVTTYQPRRVHVHQYKPEPWHLRFVGPEAADLMFSCGLSTEELLAHRYEAVAPQPIFEHMDLVYEAVYEGGWDPLTCVD